MQIIVINGTSCVAIEPKDVTMEQPQANMLSVTSVYEDFGNRYAKLKWELYHHIPKDPENTDSVDVLKKVASLSGKNPVLNNEHYDAYRADPTGTYSFQHVANLLNLTIIE